MDSTWLATHVLYVRMKNVAIETVLCATTYSHVIYLVSCDLIGQNSLVY